MLIRHTRNGKRMVLPEAPAADCRKVKIHMSVRRDAGDVQPVVVLVNRRKVRPLVPVEQPAARAHQPVKAPNRTRDPEPVLVAVHVPVHDIDVLVRAHNDEHGDDNVRHQKHLVDALADRLDRLDHEHRKANRRTTAPVPVRRRKLLRPPGLVQRNVQVDDAVQDGVHHADEGDPAVEEQKSRVRPVGQPQQEVVAARVEDDEGHVGIAQHAEAVGELALELLARRRVPHARAVVVAHRRQDNVARPQVEDEERLAARGHDAHAPPHRRGVLGAQQRRVNEVRVGPGHPRRRPWEEAQQRDGNGNGRAGEEQNETVPGMGHLVGPAVMDVVVVQGVQLLWQDGRVGEHIRLIQRLRGRLRDARQDLNVWLRPAPVGQLDELPLPKRLDAAERELRRAVRLEAVRERRQVKLIS